MLSISKIFFITVLVYYSCLIFDDHEIKISFDNEVVGEGNVNKVMENPLNSGLWLINKIAQNRKLEKTFVNELGIKTTDWDTIKSAEDIKKNQHLLPGILKSNTLGYDGKGQFVLNSLDDIKKDSCVGNDRY